MRWKEISEAPLSDFAVYGDKDNEGSFSASDVKAFNNPKWLTKVQSHFSRTPFKFNVYLFNAPEGKFHPYNDLDNPSQRDTTIHTRNLQKYFHGKLDRTEREKLLQILDTQIPRSSDAINIVMTDNEGDEKFGLTPWIMAHRVAHAVLQEFNRGYRAAGTAGGDDHSYMLKQVITALAGVLVSIKQIGKPADYFQFKSGREGTVLREGEYSVEMFTQFIVRGKLTVNEPPAPELPTFQAQHGQVGAGMQAVFEKQVDFIQRGTDIASRETIIQLIAEYVGGSPDEVRSELDRETFLDNYFTLGEYATGVQGVIRLNRSVASANQMMSKFLENCEGGTFILGAAR